MNNKNMRKGVCVLMLAILLFQSVGPIRSVASGDNFDQYLFLTQDTTISKSDSTNKTLVIAPNVSLTIAKDAVYTINGDIIIYGLLNNNGKLLVNGSIYTNNYNNMLYDDLSNPAGEMNNKGNLEVHTLYASTKKYPKPFVRFSQQLDGLEVSNVLLPIQVDTFPGLHYKVNGQEGTVNSDGTIKVGINLVDGDNTINVTITDPFGNSTTQSAVVHLARKKQVPHVIETVPVNNEKEVPLNSKIKVTYDDDIIANNLSAITLSDGQNTILISKEIENNKSIILNPKTPLEANKTYTVSIDDNAVVGKNGEIPPLYRFQFTTTGRTGNIVQGGIYEDTIWTKEKGPYIVTGNLVIFPQNTLTIEPGTEIKFARNVNMEVRGDLLAEGTEQNPIKFTAEIGEEKSYWDGIQVTAVQNNHTSFKNVEIQNAKTAIYYYGSWEEDTQIIDHVTFKNNENGLWGFMGLAPITNSTFENNTTALRGNELSIWNSIIKNNQTGMHGNINAYSNIFTGNDTAIIGSWSHIKNNQIKENKLGIQDDSGSLYIAYNDITGNDVGIEFGGSSQQNGEVVNNKIYKNSKYNVENTSSIEISALNNWWGTTNKNEIAKGIWDGYDDIQLGIIKYSPFVANEADTRKDDQPPHWSSNSQFWLEDSTENSLSFFWDIANEKLQIAKYHIYLNDKLVKTVSNKSNRATITNLKGSTNYSIKIEAEDIFGNISSDGPKLNVATLDLTPPPPPIVEGSGDSTVSIKGKAEPNATIIIKIGNSEIGRGLADKNGNFKVMIQQQIAGTKLSIYAVDKAGNIGEATMIELFDDSIPSISSIFELGENETTIGGYSEIGSTVIIKKDEKEIGRGLTGEDGFFSVKIPPQQAGTLLEISSFDKAGHTSPIVKILVREYVAPEKPIVDPITNQSKKVTGKAEPNSTIDIFTNNKKIGTGKVHADGFFSVDIPIQKDENTLEIVCVDSFSNESERVKVVVLDGIAPYAPTIKDVTDQAEYIFGTAEIGSMITVKVGAKEIGKGVTAGENYQVKIPVQKAGTIIEVTATDKSGNTSKPSKIEVKDVTAPSYPSLDEVTDQSKFITGKAEPDSVIKVWISSNEMEIRGIQIAEGTVQKDGNYKIAVTIPKEAKSLTVVAVDKANNESMENWRAIRDITAPIKPTVNKVSNRSNIVSGKAEPGTKINLFVMYGLIGTGVVDQEGSYRIPITPIFEGSELEIVSIDSSENKSSIKITVIDEISPNKPIVSGEVTDSSEIISGIAESGTTIKIICQNKVIKEGNISNEHFAIKIPKQKAGAVLQITSTDRAGNTSVETRVTVKDKTAPSKPKLNAVTDQSTIVTGKAETGSTVLLSVNGKYQKSTAAGKNGDYKFSISKQKAGTEIKVQAKDAAQNLSAATIVKVADKTAPSKPKLNAVTDKSTSITGKAETGSTVLLSVNGKYQKSTTAGKNGDYKFSISKQKAGTEIKVQAKDKAQNLSATTIIKVADKTAPSKPKLNAVTDKSTSITGKAEAGSTVLLSVNGKYQKSTTAGKNGDYKFSISKQKAGTEIKVQAKDKAQNLSAATIIKVADKTAPSKPKLNAVTDKSTSITGKAEAGSTVLLSVNGKYQKSTTAGKNGDYKFSISKQKAGTEIKVQAKDKSKNASPFIITTVKDKTPPAVPKVKKITNKTTYITGTAEKNSTVYIYKGKTSIGKGTADKKGNYKIKIKTHKKGTKLTIYAKDSSGNQSKGVTSTVSAASK